MKPQEIEIWARDIVSALQSGDPIEDSRVELKSSWIDPDKASHRLAGHANAARGEAILWLIGVDEKARAVTGVEIQQLQDWYRSVERHFDGFPPRLLIDVNIGFEEGTVVALYFDTQTEAPYVVKNKKGGGGYPEYIVPWREATGLRAATRSDLLSLLLPIRRLSALLDELDFNIVVAKAPKVVDSDAWVFISERRV